jgi:hypothetical protein
MYNLVNFRKSSHPLFVAGTQRWSNHFICHPTVTIQKENGAIKNIFILHRKLSDYNQYICWWYFYIIISETSHVVFQSQMTAAMIAEHFQQRRQIIRPSCLPFGNLPLKNYGNHFHSLVAVRWLCWARCRQSRQLQAVSWGFHGTKPMKDGIVIIQYLIIQQKLVV